MKSIKELLPSRCYGRNADMELINKYANNLVAYAKNDVCCAFILKGKRSYFSFFMCIETQGNKNCWRIDEIRAVELINKMKVVAGEDSEQDYEQIKSIEALKKLR